MAGFLQYSRVSVSGHVAEAKRFKARMAAESGIALGLHPDILPGDPLLFTPVDADTQRLIRVTSEAGRLSLQTADIEPFPEVFAELFQVWGLDPTSAISIAEAIADWIDEDDEVRDSGAESEYYTGLGRLDLPRNDTFSSLEELLLVRGFDKIDRIKPDWRDYLTLHGDGVIDFNAASAEVIEAATRASQGDIERLIQKRSGADGIPDTTDDEPFADVEEVQQILGLNDENWEEVAEKVTVDSPYRRIESTVVVGDLRYTIVVVTQSDSESGDTSFLARYEY